jgi:S1-C subfamily serine protease
VCLLAAPASARPPEQPAGSSPTRLAAATDVRDAVAHALEFTVTIEADGVYGAGILVAPSEGLVLTAHHVIEEMHTPIVTFIDGKSAPARILESDRVLDVALLQVPPQQRAAPVLGDAIALRPGEEVYAVGYPRKLGFTVSRGIVSYVGRYMDGARYLQTDLPINDGNSGGPVVNARGELVGMMSFILRRAQGISFALPANYAPHRFPRLAALAGDAGYLTRFRHWLGAAAALPTSIHPAP